MVENKEITEQPSTLRHGVQRAHGGFRPGAGRKPKPKNPSLLQKAYVVLDEAIIPAVQSVIKLLRSRNEMTRLRAAQVILDKRIPDLSSLKAETKPRNLVLVYGSKDGPAVKPVIDCSKDAPAVPGAETKPEEGGIKSPSQ